MEKYSEKKKKNSGKILLLILLLILLTVLLVALVWLAAIMGQWEVPLLEHTDRPGQSTEAEQEGHRETEPAATEPEVTEPAPVELGDGLQILSVGSYAGIYMEDGTDEPVADVMIIILENTAEQDLRLARISMEYASGTAEFEVTNIPAGERVVALEKNRQGLPEGDCLNVKTQNVVFFGEAMSLQEDRISVRGEKGILEVTNLSGEDIVGDIYVYYKNSAGDLLYGGITYRVTVKGGLAAGESTRIVAGHYTPDNSRLLMVECVGK